MGNASTHAGGASERERRKSRGNDQYGSIPAHHPGSAGVGGSVSDAINLAAAQHHQRRNSTSGHRGYDDVGAPVMVTAAARSKGATPPSSAGGGGGGGAATRTRSVMGSSHGGGGPDHRHPHRPRATTEVGRRTRQISLDQSTLNSDFLPGTSPGSGPAVSDNLVPSKKALPTIFKFSGDAKEVYVCGSFNNWEKLPMNKSTKDFSTLVNLEEGDYEYKFLVDGRWITDPAGSPTVTTKDGIQNNLLRVRKEDFNAFDALDMDSQAVNAAKINGAAANGGFSSSSSSFYRPQAEFGQELPPANPPFGSGGGGGGQGGYRSAGPPILPPHLLQVILNKDTPLSCEPTLLPEPNHVMLNHLYALSIKDGVMVLSSTHRYRKKYVTTLLYKPMGARKAGE